MEKKAQVEITFHWIYVLIAGAVILLFFVGLAVKQKASSEERLATDVVQILETIFTGAGVSEQTKNFINTGGLADYELSFSCADGVTEYGLQDLASVQNTVDAIFAPEKLQTSLLILWSLPYQLPFKGLDFLLVTSSNTKYVLVGDSGGFRREFADAAFDQEERLRLNVEEAELLTLDTLDPGKAYQVRFIFLDGTLPSLPVPEGVRDMDDDKVSAMVFSSEGALEQATYYQKKRESWQQAGEPVPIISLGGERDAAKYAAVVAGNAEMYQCTMQKAFRRLEYVLAIYAQKLQSLQGDYADDQNCLRFYSKEVGGERSLEDSISTLQSVVRTCSRFPEQCSEGRLLQTARLIEETNNQAAGECQPLY